MRKPFIKYYVLACRILEQDEWLSDIINSYRNEPVDAGDVIKEMLTKEK